MYVRIHLPQTKGSPLFDTPIILEPFHTLDLMYTILVTEMVARVLVHSLPSPDNDVSSSSKDSSTTAIFNLSLWQKGIDTTFREGLVLNVGSHK